MGELTREQHAALEWARNNFGSGYPKELVMLVAQLQRENATLRQQYADGLAAWKANNAQFAGENQALRERVRWRPMEEAPKDGTRFLAWCVHPDMGDREDYRGAVIAYWTDFGGGGWVWSGLVGKFTGWMPLPAIGPLPGEGS